jgi:hypothetical protein
VGDELPSGIAAPSFRIGGNDGCLDIYGIGDQGIPAFTDDAIECLKQIIEDVKSRERCPSQDPIGEIQSLRR